MDDKIIGLYAAGLTVRDIQAHLLDLYGLKVSPDLISRVTDAVLDEVREWQSRALDRMYPIVIFDALRVKIRDADSRTVKNKAVYIALGVTRDGLREVLGRSGSFRNRLGPAAAPDRPSFGRRCRSQLRTGTSG